MLSRTLVLAAAALYVGGAAAPAVAQNLEAGKAPAQIFKATCSLCHKSPRGLLKTVSPSGLPTFLRQHYTTGPDMASELSAYVLSNGASDKRPGDDSAREGQRTRRELREDKRREREQAAPGPKEELKPAARSAETPEVESAPKKRNRRDKHKPKPAAGGEESTHRDAPSESGPVAKPDDVKTTPSSEPVEKQSETPAASVPAVTKPAEPEKSGDTSAGKGADSDSMKTDTPKAEAAKPATESADRKIAPDTGMPVFDLKQQPAPTQPAQ